MLRINTRWNNREDWCAVWTLFSCLVYIISKIKVSSFGWGQWQEVKSIKNSNSLLIEDALDLESIKKIQFHSLMDFKWTSSNCILQWYKSTTIKMNIEISNPAYVWRKCWYFDAKECMKLEFELWFGSDKILVHEQAHFEQIQMITLVW